jgi:hypothetical protein
LEGCSNLALIQQTWLVFGSARSDVQQEQGPPRELRD